MRDAPSLPGAVDVVVVGGGVSGLAAAYRLQKLDPSMSVLVFEASERPGGTATTDRVGDFLVDRGPNGVLSNVPYTLDLAHELGVKPVRAAAEAKRRYLYKSGRLRALPGSLLSPHMLGVGGALRAAIEPLVRTPPPEDDESVAAFIRRRFGARAGDLLAGAMVSGVTAGDAEQTSIRALFPRIAEVEEKHGSVLRGMSKERDRAAPKTALHSFEGGMGAIADALARALGDRLRLGQPVTRVARMGDRWRLEAGSASFEARAVIVAAPAPSASRVFASSLPDLASHLGAVPYAGIRVVTIAYRRELLERSLDGFGFLVPRGEGIRSLGSVWTSTVFPDRAPPDHHLLRVMIGGVFEPDAARWSDSEAESVVLAELSSLLGTRGEPTLVHHAAWPTAIPQYALGHRARVAALREEEARHPGLRVCGNAWDGVSLNESVAAANEAAQRVVDYLRS